MTADPVPLGRRIHDQALERENETAVVFVPVEGSERPVTWMELDASSTRLAHRLQERGVVEEDLVAIGLRNSPEHVIAALAVWKCGAGVLTMRWDVPDWERNRLLGVTRPRLLISNRDDEGAGPIPIVDVRGAEGFSTDPLPDRVPLRPIAIPSGGSTGESKAVYMPFPGAIVPGTAFSINYDMFGIEPIQRNIVFGPLYHANPFAAVHASLFDGHLVILHEKFRADQVVASIRRHRPQYITLAPTMMKRLLDVDGIENVDWSCFHIVLHGTAPCPPWLKRRWIEMVGAERLWEIFASTELVGSVVVRGDEWLQRPGTVGRPTAITELKILDENGAGLPAGDVGEIYMRIKGTTAPVFEYLGADRPKVTGDGFASVGDLGYVDDDGYLYSADRRTDLIITGGANVVPAEVEAAIGEHPGVADVVVIGLPDEEWGTRVHAIVVPAEPTDPPSNHELEAHCRQRIARYKVPKSFEIIDKLPRTEMFKIRRSALAAERR